MNVYFDAFAKYVCATLIVALVLFLTKISICGALMRATTTMKEKKTRFNCKQQFMRCSSRRRTRKRAISMDMRNFEIHLPVIN